MLRLPVTGAAGQYGGSVAAPADPERELLGAALKGASGAAATLTRAIADPVWTACLRVTRDRAETEAAFRDVMATLQADSFARLKGFNGTGAGACLCDARRARPVVGAGAWRDGLTTRVTQRTELLLTPSDIGDLSLLTWTTILLAIY